MGHEEPAALVLGAAARAPGVLPGAPRLSAAQAPPLRAIDAIDEQGGSRPLCIPIERPLTLVLDGRELVTLMTLGAAPEWLVLGYLRNQRLIDAVTELHSVEVDWREGVARIATRAGAAGRAPDAAAPAAGPRGMLGCALGTEFGAAMRLGAEAAGAEARRARPRIAHAELIAILESMREHDAIHRAAGSVHSAALFRGGELWVAVEDVSRHNGIDTVTGFMVLHGIDGGDKILFTTGRLTGEMVMKAAHNGIPVMISRNGVTAIGCELAAARGMTLIGRAANRRYLCYVGAGSIEFAARAAPPGAAGPGVPRA